MGGSTNTVLHLLAAAHEAGVDFTMADIDRMSRKVPNLCKVAPSTQKYHMEDVHRAGGIMAILGELDRAGLMHRDLPDRAQHDHGRGARHAGTSRAPATRTVHDFYRAAPGGVPTQTAFSQNRRYADTRSSTAPTAASATSAHAYSQDGGLAVLYGNIARERLHRQDRRRR